MEQAKKKPVLPTISYADGELAKRLEEQQRKLDAVLKWANDGAWIEDGTDRLFRILKG